jgi:hypothetical protein
LAPPENKVNGSAEQICEEDYNYPRNLIFSPLFLYSLDEHPEPKRRGKNSDNADNE